MNLRVILVLVSTLVLLFFLGCGSGGSSSPSGETTTGTVKILLTDAPGPYQSVYVTIDEVLVHKDGECVANDVDTNDDNATETDGSDNETEISDDCDGGWYTVATPGQTIDLLTLQDNVTMALGEVDIATGMYDQLRLILGDVPDNGTNILNGVHPFANYIVFPDNSSTELKVPSGKLQQKNYEFELIETGVFEIVVDFDAEQSIHQAGNSGQWILTPVLGITGEQQDDNDSEEETEEDQDNSSVQ